MTTVAQQSLNFLIVQDSTLSAIDLECVLEDIGHRVVEVAVTPDAAHTRLQAVSHRVDAVIFDAMQVGLPAYQLAREAERLGVPAVVTSSYPETFVRVLGFQQPCLSKPYRHDAVVGVTSTLEPRAADSVAA